MNRKELERTVQALADDAISGEEFAALQQELRDNPAARAFYRESMEAEILLAEALRQNSVLGECQGGMDTLLEKRRRRDLYRSLMAAAAVLLLAALIMALVVIRRPDIPTLSCTPVAGTQWRVSGNPSGAAGAPQRVTAGSTVRVDSGSVKLELESGVVMLLRGPAVASFPSLNRPVLSNGWLWVDSGKSDEPFAVETPNQIVRDIGTRFGVRVRDNGDAEVHLVEGELMITPKRAAGEKKKLRVKPDGKGLLLPAWGQPAALPLSSDPLPDLPKLLKMAAIYPTAILSQGPEGYWRLEDGEGYELANEVRGGRAGKFSFGATPGMPGVGSGGVLGGFPPGNGCMQMNADPMTSVLFDLDIPGGVSRQEGALSFWIRRAPDQMREEVLWLAGKDRATNNLNPRQAMIHTQLSRDGRVEFLMKNGKHDISLSSNFSVCDGNWHHIAASWGRSGVGLYVDGRRVMLADDYGDLQRGTFRGRFIRFGKPSSEQSGLGKRSFSGQVDEIALWARPLSGLEVSHQFRAAMELQKEPAPTD